MVAVVACPAPILQFLDNTGSPAVGGSVLTQVAGVNTATYSDSAGLVPLPNPIPLNSRGEVSTAAGTSSQLFLQANVVYQFTLFDDATPPNQLWVANYVNGVQITQAQIGALLYPPLPSEGATVLAGQWPYGDIRRYGALSGGTPSLLYPLVPGPGGNGDCTTAIANAIAAMGFAFVPAGDWRQDGQILQNGSALVMEAGAVITRYAANSTATTPLYWQQGSYCTITGQGLSSQIVTENKAPSGVVLNGCLNMTSDSPLGADANYNECSNVKLVGMQAYGQTSGAPDICYLQCNPQLDGHTVYFAFINTLIVNAANYGVLLQGDANGDLITDVQGYWIGNTKRIPPTGVPPASAAVPTPGGDATIFMQGSLENKISGGFSHFSPGTPYVRIEDYDNRATSGGALHICSYFNIGELICEQGDYSSAFVGAGWTAPAVDAQAIVANANCSAFSGKIDINDNTSGGSDISSVFYFNNEVNLISGGPSYPNFTTRQTLQVGNPNPAKLVGTLTSGSPTIAAVGPPGIFAVGGVPSDCLVGATITGTGIAAGTTISAITPTADTETGTITMSANASGAATGTPTLITYSTPPGTLLVGAGKRMPFVTPAFPQATATTIIPTGNITVTTAVMVLVSIQNADVNAEASRTDLLLINPRNTGFSASTVTNLGSAYTSGGGAYEPNAVSYTLSTASPASVSAPALQVSVTPLSGSGHTYTAICQFVSTG